MAAATYEEVLQLLTVCFAESLPHHDAPGPDDVLYGTDGIMDSMDVVNFATDVEDRVNERFRSAIVLADARALSHSRSPFRSLSALAAFCVDQLAAPQS